MELKNEVAVVTGGASGLGLAVARRLSTEGARVVVVDFAERGSELISNTLTSSAHYCHADVTDTNSVRAAFETAARIGPIRAMVHCAGRGGTVRLVERNGSPGDIGLFADIVQVNLIGTYNVLRHAAAAMSANDPIYAERGAVVLTSSIAAYEGQVGQIAYAASKAAVVGMTITAARELARHKIRVNTIAPGVFDTPILARLSEEQRGHLAASVPHPSRLGEPDEFAQLAAHVIANRMLNGETIRLDGALRMAAR